MLGRTIACSRRSTRPPAPSSTKGGRYLVTDTVGFIRRLPHQLVEGFAATLEETLSADLVLHVADAPCSRRPARTSRSRPSRPSWPRSARTSSPSSSSSTRSTPSIPSAGAAFATASRTRSRSLPEPVRVSTSCKARIAERFAERFEPVRLLDPAHGRRVASQSSTSSARRSSSGSDLPEGVLLRRSAPARKMRPRSRAISSPTPATRRPATG